MILMLPYPAIDPVALHLGPLSIHWYGIMYLVGFIAGWGLLAKRLQKSTHPFLTSEQLSDVIFYTALGVIIGGRLGYMLLYDKSHWLTHPFTIFEIWKGGMAFHGGLIGVIFVLGCYAWRTKKKVGDLLDFIAPVVPIGLAAGRIGNFINGELWGRITDVPWAMIFPGTSSPRHPSQLYEFFLEGIILFIILWQFSKTPRPRWVISGLFLFLYGLFRFIIEFFREPDVQMGFVVGRWMTQGQLLCLPMIALGFILLLRIRHKSAD